MSLDKSAYARQYYETHQEYYRAHREQRKAACRAIVDEYRSRPCVDCKYTFPSCVMEFDHVRGNPKTKKTIAYLTSTATPVTLLREIANCDVVCANCHTVRTFARGENLRGGYFPREIVGEMISSGEQLATSHK